MNFLLGTFATGGVTDMIRMTISLHGRSHGPEIQELSAPGHFAKAFSNELKRTFHSRKVRLCVKKKHR
jgi:hypothetical protein